MCDENTGIAVIEQRNRVFEDDNVEILRPYDDFFTVKLTDLKDQEGNKIDKANRAQMIFTAKVAEPLKVNDMLIKGK